MNNASLVLKGLVILKKNSDYNIFTSFPLPCPPSKYFHIPLLVLSNEWPFCPLIAVSAGTQVKMVTVEGE